MRAIILQASFACLVVAATDQFLLQEGIDIGNTVGNTVGNYLSDAVYQLRGGKDGKICQDRQNRISCNVNWIGGWEKFTFRDQGNSNFAIKGGKKKKWCQDAGSEMKCKANKIQGWEKFRVMRSGLYYALKSGKSKRYCSDHGWKITCGANKLQGWEKFYIAHDLSALKKSKQTCHTLNKYEIPLPKMLRDAIDENGGYTDVSFQACHGRRRTASSLGGTVKTFFTAWKIDGYWDFYEHNKFQGKVSGRMQICYLYKIRPIHQVYLEIALIAQGNSQPSIHVYLCVNGDVQQNGAKVKFDVSVDAEFHEGDWMGKIRSAVGGKLMTGGIKLAGSFSMKNFKVVNNKPTWSDAELSDLSYEAFLTYGDDKVLDMYGKCYADASGAANWTATLVYNEAFDAKRAAENEAARLKAELEAGATLIQQEAEAAMLVAESLGQQLPQNEAEREALANSMLTDAEQTATRVATEVQNDPQGSATNAGNSMYSAGERAYNAGSQFVDHVYNNYYR